MPCSLSKSSDVSEEYVASIPSFACYLFQADFLLGLVFSSEDGSNTFRRNAGLTFIGLYGGVSHEVEPFKIEAFPIKIHLRNDERLWEQKRQHVAAVNMDITNVLGNVTPWSQIQSYQCIETSCWLHLKNKRIAALMMETRSSEALVAFCQTIRRHIPQDSNDLLREVRSTNWEWV